MTYEICKQLKDAGFPQNFVEGRKAIVKSNNNDYCFEPTLSELIEACGDRFDKLELTQSLDGKTKEWEATGDRYWNGYGSTPEEAVAKLWLALNKK